LFLYNIDLCPICGMAHIWLRPFGHCVTGVSKHVLTYPINGNTVGGVSEFGE